jgi:outer membrane protein TolC
LALERQPAVAAARASLLAAQVKVNALHNMGKLANLLRHDLPVRQQQAALGVLAAEARLHQTEVETLYSVTRCYWTVVYAQTQLRLADNALDKDPKKQKSLHGLRATLDKARRKREEERWAVRQFDSLIALTEGQREEARQGALRAQAALREAVGLDPDCPLTLQDEELPEAAGSPSREQIVALAADRRDEIIQARLAAEVTELEIQAQCLNNNLKVETFASGSDLHAVILPSASFGDDYRPGPLGIEMPATLVGPRCQRMEQAQALHSRTEAVLTKSRGLIRLEAENTWLQWTEARAKAESYEKAAVTAAEVSEEGIKELLGDAPEKIMATTSTVFTTVLLRASLRVQANQARFKMVIEQAALERVTAGGYCPEYRQVKRSENGEKDKSEKPKENKE